MGNYKPYGHPTVTLAGVTVDIPVNKTGYEPNALQVYFYNHAGVTEIKSLHKNSNNENVFLANDFYLIGIRIFHANVSSSSLYKIWNNGNLDTASTGLIAEINLPKVKADTMSPHEYFLGILCTSTRLNSETIAANLINRVEMYGYEIP